MDVYIETGLTRFAGAVGWPGWCRAGLDEQSAMQSLLLYAPRYARVLEGTGLDFPTPPGLQSFQVVERVKGNGTTDFGAPNVPLAADTLLLDEGELNRVVQILSACWAAFDQAVALADGKSLRTGPRGGGRDINGIVEHVLGAEEAYLSKMGGKRPKETGASLERQIDSATRLSWIPWPPPRAGRLRRPDRVAASTGCRTPLCAG